MSHYSFLLLHLDCKFKEQNGVCKRNKNGRKAFAGFIDYVSRGDI